MADRRMPHQEFFEHEAEGDHIALGNHRKVCQALLFLLAFALDQQAQIEALKARVDALSQHPSDPIEWVDAIITENADMTFNVKLTGTTKGGATRDLTDADGVLVSVVGAGTYNKIDATSGTLVNVGDGATGSLVFTGPNGEDLGQSDTYTGGSAGGDSDALAHVGATITPAE